jgi:hypothetical protein
LDFGFTIEITCTRITRIARMNTDFFFIEENVS